MTTYLSLAIGACFLLAFLIKCNKKRSVPGVFLKSLTSVFFILTAVTGAFNNTANPEAWRYAILIAAGGVLGLMGDIYLDQKWLYPEHSDQYLNLGFTSFALGHFFYIGAMYTHAKFEIKDLLIAIGIGALIMIVNMILEKPTKQDYGKFKAITIAYTLILGTMVGTAFWAAILTKQVSYIVFTIGAISFLVSDIILSPMYFSIKKNKNTPFNFVLNHVTYYVGQFMIAFTAFLLAAN